MGSVDSPMWKSREPQCGVSSVRTQLLQAACAPAALAALAWMFAGADSWRSAIWPVLLLVLLWSFHLERAALGGLWAFVLPLLVGAQLLLWLRRVQDLPPHAILSASASCVLLYLLMKTVGGTIAQPELQGISSAAAILALALHAGALEVVLSGAFSLILLARCRRPCCGTLKAALLIYLPSVFGIFTVLTARKMIPGFWLQASSTFASLSGTVHILAPRNANGELHALSPIFIFATAAILTRIVERLAGYGDLAVLGTMLLAACFAATGKWPDMLRPVDLGVILYVAAMSLIALSPPRRLPSLSFLLASICASCWVSAP